MSASDFSGTETVATSSSSGMPNWQDQDAMLRDLWMQNKTPAAIAEALGRSVAAIMTRAARLGLPRRFAPGRKPGRHPSSEQTTKNPSRSVPRLPTDKTEAAAQTSTRVCLMCLTPFQSLGRHNRICSSCKGSAEYESASRLPDPDFSVADV